MNTLKPVAFLGFDAGRVVNELYKLEAQFLPTVVPSSAKLERVIQGLEPLGFLGAVFVGAPSQEAIKLVDGVTSSAERDGAIDAIGVIRGTQGTHTLEDGLLAALDAIGYRGFGSNALVIGGDASASAAVQVARAGVKNLTIAAPDRPHAERLARYAPAGVSIRAISSFEPAFAQALERADLLLLCDQKFMLEPRHLQPYHTLIEVAAESSLSVALERIGGQIISHKTVQKHHLAAQLEFVIGRRLKLDALFS
ncbi:MAG: hypothetical protein ACK41E_07960 [Deinococcales bacterium]